VHEQIMQTQEGRRRRASTRTRVRDRHRTGILADREGARTKKYGQALEKAAAYLPHAFVEHVWWRERERETDTPQERQSYRECMQEHAQENVQENDALRSRVRHTTLYCFTLLNPVPRAW